MSEFDKELVVVCHCYRHPPLFYRPTTGEMIPLGPDVQYVDPAVCPDMTWDTIADESKQYVYGMHCPVAPGVIGMGQHMYHFGTKVMLEILEHAWRVLKRGGKVIFPGGYTVDKNRIEAFQAIIDADEHRRFKHRWTFSFESIDNLPFNIGKSPRSADNNVAAVFTKPVGGGRRSPDLRVATYLRTSRSPRRTGYCECEAIARLAEPPDNAKWRRSPRRGEPDSPTSKAGWSGHSRHSHV